MKRLTSGEALEGRLLQALMRICILSVLITNDGLGWTIRTAHFLMLDVSDFFLLTE